jgi:hypothetical protein
MALAISREPARYSRSSPEPLHGSSQTPCRRWLPIVLDAKHFGALPCFHVVYPAYSRGSRGEHRWSRARAPEAALRSAPRPEGEDANAAPSRGGRRPFGPPAWRDGRQRVYGLGSAGSAPRRSQRVRGPPAWRDGRQRVYGLGSAGSAPGLAASACAGRLRTGPRSQRVRGPAPHRALAAASACADRLRILEDHAPEGLALAGSFATTRDRQRS